MNKPKFNTYIIINRTALEKMRKELNEGSAHHDGIYVSNYQHGQIDLIDVIISSQSIPLIPEIEKHAIEFTKTLLNGTVSEAKSIDNIKKYHPKEYQLLLGELELNGKKIFEDYISNLKLDI